MTQSGQTYADTMRSSSLWQAAFGTQRGGVAPINKLKEWLSTRVPPYLLEGLAWCTSLILFVGAALYLPSITSVIFALTALLLCPARPLGRLMASSDARKRLPESLAKGTVPVWLATIAIIIGSFITPGDEKFSFNALLDFSTARAVASGPIEYTRDPVDLLDYVTCTSDHVSLSVVDDVDPTVVGTQKVSLALREGRFERTETLEVEVQDTRAPIVVFTKPSVTVQAGEKFDVNDNIAVVRDPVDGPLEEVDAKPTAHGVETGKERIYEQGWYLVLDAPDCDVAGTYETSVVACDQHGNRTTEKLSVVVENAEATDVDFEPTPDDGQSEAPEARQAPSDAAEAEEDATPTHYVLNTNSLKFHYPNCGDVEIMAQGNRLDVTKTRDEILEMGYSPCGHCNP